ncbi:nucleoside phosphorylase [Streptococcus cuniculi]|uniref:Uridine phosphorylase n=1 Tax=Streptococcus cuniculi TaxID=1432788 RepID=A0A4Y9JCN6_9STRE|nr:nucleoside phosphorylase [Streptococcus cuniculi]MBF0778391.1 nucleoside phosphorylase [Streptococcus cuniculi]TFU97674.1 phosphorylase [Streptococcus cuniculi]
MLLEEFEPVKAVIEPGMARKEEKADICSTLILTFSGQVVEQVRQMDGVHEGGALKNLNGRHPWYIYEKDGCKVAVGLALVGAPMAVGQLEEYKALGFENFIIFGTCGVLDKNIAADKLILPSAALRDEGTSYHYAPPSDEISYEPALLSTMEKILDKYQIQHIRTKTWTTDAFYRETAAKVKRRKASGAEVVEMEAASIMAWSRFREAKVYQFFYTADYVDHHQEEWDPRREERKLNPMTFFEIAFTIAKELQVS